MLQLDPMIPCYVLKGYGWPEGSGYCVGWIDYSQDHDTLWKVAYDLDGVIYDVPQSHVRLQFNISMGRSKEKSSAKLS